MKSRQLFQILVIIAIITTTQAEIDYYKKIFQKPDQLLQIDDSEQESQQQQMERPFMKEQWKLCVENQKNITTEVDSELGPIQLWVSTDECAHGTSTASIFKSEIESIIFEGELQLGDKGFGFVGMNTVKSEVPLFNEDISSIKLTLKGDGQKYLFKLSYSDEMFAPAWVQTFTAPENSTEIEFLIKDFKPFGKFSNETEFDIKNVTVLSIQLMVSDEQLWDQKGRFGRGGEHERQDRGDENEHQRWGRFGRNDGHERYQREEEGEQEEQGRFGRNDGHERQQQGGEEENERQGRFGRPGDHERQSRDDEEDQGRQGGRHGGHKKQFRGGEEESERQGRFGRNDGHERQSRGGEEEHKRPERFGRNDGHERQRNDDSEYERQERFGRRDGHERQQRGDESDYERQGRNDGHERQERFGRNDDNERQGPVRLLKQDFEQFNQEGKFHGRGQGRRGMKGKFLKEFFEELSNNHVGPFYLEIEDMTFN